MQIVAYVAAALVVAWAALAIVAHLLNPGQDPMSMGMSGLARGRAPWVMKSAFALRGGSALVLLIAVPGALGTGGLTLAGIAVFWVWGVGSAALAVIDTDMPGEPPTRAGAAHALVALAAYVAGVVGAVLLSLVLLRDAYTGRLGDWAMALALTAAAFMVAQFAAFRAAAQEAWEGGANAAPAFVAAPATAATPVIAAAVASAAPLAVAAVPVPPQLTGVPPQSTGAGSARATGRAPGFGRWSSGWLDALARYAADLAPYAGLLQRVFVGLLMAWTLLVALGLGQK